MLLALFTVAALISVTPSCAAEPESLITPNEDSLQYVYAFFRHGIRTPLNEPYPNDPNKSKYHKYLPGPPGQLTKIGKRLMYNVGKKLKQIYGNFLGNYTDEKVHVSSTGMSRTITSALSVMAGLFPPTEPILEDLPKWQPIPVWEDTEVFDKAFIYNDLKFPEIAKTVCPSYAALIQKGVDIVDNPDKTKGNKKIYKLLIKNTGKTDVNSLDNLYKIWDTLQFESLNGLPLPSWATDSQPEFKHKPLYPDLMEPLMVQWFLDTEYLNKNKDMLDFYSGPLFNNLYKEISKKVQQPRCREKMRFHATHDTTLFVILWALGLDKPAAVRPGDGIVFELHTINGKPIVKVLYFDTNNDDVKELELPRCPSPCRLHQFIKTTPSLTPQQWEQKCHD